MNKKIKIGICGYGNLGRGVETEIIKNPDMELAAVFTRRNPAELTINAEAPVVHIEAVSEWKNQVDVMVLCGGSAKDLPEQGPELAKIFNTVDSFDTHANVPQYFNAVNNSAIAGNNISIISVGWDPGMFSLMRLYMESIIPKGKSYTFWGKGVSQGHSEAIRRIKGVLDAVQYTIPVEAAVERVRKGETPELDTRERHTRVCYVVAAENSEHERIEREIKEMPHYFSEYDTAVYFITDNELKTNHNKLMHGGSVIHIGETGLSNSQIMEFSLKLDSNPEFTASVLLAFARAAYRLSVAGERGARTVFDIAPRLLLNIETEAAIEKLM